MTEVTGRLEGWYYDEIHHVVWGHLYEDVRKRWWEGVHIHTSTLQEDKDKVLSLKEGDTIKTRNSVYLLGRPFSSAPTYGTD